MSAEPDILFAAVQVNLYVRDQYGHRYPNRVTQYGIKFVSTDYASARDYVRRHAAEFLDNGGWCGGRVVRFRPADFPQTMRYMRESPRLGICFHSEAERMAECVVDEEDVG